MKINIKSSLILIIWSLLAALLSAFILYSRFSQLLCTTVYGDSKSDASNLENHAAESNSQYIQYFSPRFTYLKTVIIRVSRSPENKAVDNTLSENVFIEEKLLNNNEKVLAKGEIALTDIEDVFYSEFSVEKWMKTDQEYQLVVSFPGHDDLAITLGPQDIGPQENHILTIDGKETGKNMYVQYIYGCYSKKLFTLWFLAFFLAAFLSGEWVMLHKRTKSERKFPEQ